MAKSKAKRTAKKLKPITKDNILFLCIGVALLAYSAFNFYEVYKIYPSKYWPSVYASVEESGVIEHTQTSLQKYAAGTTTQYLPVIYYAYKVPNDNKVYKNHIIESIFPPAFALPEQAEKVLQQHIQNGLVKIYYDPHNHANSVIIPSVKFEKLSVSIFPLIFGLLFFVPSIIVIVRKLKQTKI